jgi:hypothetical protein
MALTPEQQAMDFNPELQDVSRQRKLADLLLAQGMQQPQGQMISGRYVAPSWTQQLNPMANVLASQAVSSRADTEQAKLAEALRTRKSEALATFQELMSSPETRGQAMKYAAKQPDLQGIVQELMKPRDVAEGGKVVIPGIGTEGIEIAKGNPRYRAPIHYDLGNYISVRDPYDATKEIQRLPKGISPESAARLADEGIGGYGGGVSRPVMPTMPTINQGSPILAKPNVSLAPNAPTYAQNQVSMPAAGVNPYEEFNKSIIPPAGLPPKDQRKWMAEANSPVTGEAAKQVTGAINTISAIDDLRNLVSEATRTGIVSPEQRAKIDAAKNTMNLLSKEAYNLGVLNGPDLSLINSLTVDFNNPKSLLLSKETLDKLLEKQRNIMGTTVQNVYGTQQKKIPEFVINKLKPNKTEITSAQAGKIERPSTVDETTWNYMTPAEKALFRK